MTSLDSPCSYCARKRRGSGYPPTCEAFPDGIQEEILLGELDHTSPYPATMACAGRSPTTPPRRSRRRRTPSRIASAPEFQNEPLLPNQVDRLLHIADERGERLANLWRVVFTAGLRSAEARGLRWRDVDLDAGIMRIRLKLEEPTGKPWYFGELKSVRARREIALIDQSRQALQAQRDLQSFDRHKLESGYYEEHDLVFADGLGRPLSQATMDHAFKLLLGRARIDGSAQTIHNTRHACNTWLISSGVPLVIVQMIMGHGNAQMSRHRAHANELMLKAAGEALEMYLARHQGAARA